jgi:phage-related protein
MEVKYWTAAYTRDYVAEFIEKQPVKMQKKIFRDLDLVEKYGTGFANMKKLHGYNMHEIKIKACRILCAVRGAVCWLLHAFIKKSGNTPPHEIKTAFRRMKELDTHLALNLA